MATNGSYKWGLADSLNADLYIVFHWELLSQSFDSMSSSIRWHVDLVAGASGHIDHIDDNYTGNRGWTVTIDGKQYSGSTSPVIASGETKALTPTNTTEIKHNSDGAKNFNVNVFLDWDFVPFGDATYLFAAMNRSASIALPKIVGLSSVSMSGGTLGKAHTVKVTQKVSSYTHTITYRCGTASGTICTKSSQTSISWTPPLELARQNTTGENVSITLRITTYKGAEDIGYSESTISCAIPASIVPTISTVEIYDSKGYADTYGGYVQNKSNLVCIITASGAYGSTIAAYLTEFDGDTNPFLAAGFMVKAANAIFENGKCTLTLKYTVTDSRGRKASGEKSVTVYEYDSPAVRNVVVKRVNASGEESPKGAYLAVQFDADIASISGKNSAVYAIQYKAKGAAQYTTATLSGYTGDYSVTGAAYRFAADINSAYDIIISATDDFSATTRTVSGQAAIRFFSILHKGLGLALGKIAELAGVFEIAFQTKPTGGFYPVYLEPGTDFNDVIIPNVYSSVYPRDVGYATHGLSYPDGTDTPFTLDVVAIGNQGELMQTATIYFAPSDPTGTGTTRNFISVARRVRRADGTWSYWSVDFCNDTFLWET